MWEIDTNLVDKLRVGGLLDEAAVETLQKYRLYGQTVTIYDRLMDILQRNVQQKRTSAKSHSHGGGRSGVFKVQNLMPDPKTVVKHGRWRVPPKQSQTQSGGASSSGSRGSAS